MRLLLVVNPRASHGRAAGLLPEIERGFAVHGVALDMRPTGHRRHGVDIVRDSDLAAYDGVVAAGGDGTLFEVVTGYFENAGDQRPPIGVMPIGTGNAFARDLGLETFGVATAVEVICGGRTRPIDVGRFASGGRVWHFLNILGLGFVSDVTATAHRLKALGNASYTLGVVWQTLFLKAHGLHLEIDGRVLEREGIFLEISNSRYTSNFLMAPDAEIDDGLLDVTLLKGVSRRRLLSAFPKVFTGEHVHLDEVETFKARHVSVRTDVPKLLAPDGELEGTTPVEVECLHRAVEVFV